MLSLLEGLKIFQFVNILEFVSWKGRSRTFNKNLSSKDTHALNVWGKKGREKRGTLDFIMPAMFHTQS